MPEPSGPPPGRQPLFLARQNYRRRRVMDAARLLPVLAAFLFLMPALWGGDGEGRRPTAGDGIYLILAWAALIAMSFLISRALRGAAGEDGGGEDAGGDADNALPQATRAPLGGNGSGNGTG